jgi:hypothetical protein
MIVEILVTTDCPNEDAAIDLVGVAASALKMTPKVMLVEVTDLSEARQQRFPGSPTIRIDGRDVSPPSGAEASLSCRTYATSHGPSGVPEFGLLIAALERATGRGGQSD